MYLKKCLNFVFIVNLLLLAHLYPLISYGQDTLSDNYKHILIIDTLRDVYLLADYLYFLPDSGEEYTIRDLENGKLDSLFSSDRNNINAGSCYWAMFKINNLLEKDVELVLQWDNLETNLYHPTPNGFVLKKSGKNVPVKEWNIKNSWSNTGLYIKDKTTQIFYIKIKNNYFTSGSLLNPQYILQKKKIKFIVFTAMLSILLVLMLYNTVIFFIIKDKSYLFYSLAILCTVFYVLGREVDTASFFINLEYYNYYDLISLSCAILFHVFYIYFIRFFFSTKKQFPKWNKIFFYFQLIHLATLILLITVIIPPTNTANEFSYPYFWEFFNGFALVSVLSYFVFAIVALRSKYLPARYFFIANALFFIFFTIYLLTFLGGILPFNDFTRHSFDIGLVSLLILFSVALASKFNYTNKKLLEERIRREQLERQRADELEVKVQERTLQLSQANEELNSTIEIVNQQKEKIETAHTNITDSINYASRIQAAVIPENVLKNVLPEHFIFFKPRDVVSGDFYWMKDFDKYTIVSAVDCTGHGVPGAFMSMLGTAFLNEIVNQRNARKPGEILNELRSKVKISLKQKGLDNEAKDGMDIALYTIDKENMKLYFAGAYNSIYLVRNGDKIEGFDMDKNCKVLKNETHTLFDIKGDRQPIGIYFKEKPFTTKVINIEKGDMFYVFSDGYADQQGGDLGHKFMTKNFKHLILNNCEKDMVVQNEILNNTLKDWIGSKYGQVDDILVIGVKI